MQYFKAECFLYYIFFSFLRLLQTTKVGHEKNNKGFLSTNHNSKICETDSIGIDKDVLAVLNA